MRVMQERKKNGELLLTLLFSGLHYPTPRSSLIQGGAMSHKRTPMGVLGLPRSSSFSSPLLYMCLAAAFGSSAKCAASELVQPQ